MTISDASFLILSLIAGLGMGLFYFGGLWLTVRRVTSSRWHILLVMGSFIGRNAVCAVIFWLLARGGNWQRALVCLVGFVVARMFLVRRLRPQKAASIQEER